MSIYRYSRWDGSQDCGAPHDRRPVRPPLRADPAGRRPAGRAQPHDALRDARRGPARPGAAGPARTAPRRPPAQPRPLRPLLHVRRHPGAARRHRRQGALGHQPAPRRAGALVRWRRARRERTGRRRRRGPGRRRSARWERRAAGRVHRHAAADGEPSPQPAGPAAAGRGRAHQAVARLRLHGQRRAGGLRRAHAGAPAAVPPAVLPGDAGEPPRT